MSVQDVLKRIDLALRKRDGQLGGLTQYQQGLGAALDDFDTDLLIQADNESGKELLQVFADIAVVTSEQRKEKFPKTDSKKISTSDFIPSFGYISSMGRSRFEFRAVLSRYRSRFGSSRGIFKANVVRLVRKSCPWCPPQ